MSVVTIPLHKRVQIARATTALNNAYIGLIGELTMDTTRKELRLHDGSKIGGHRVCSLSVLQALFLAVDSEAGRLKFNSSGLGLVTRISDGAYALRQIKVEDGLVITNPKGTDGDFTLALPERLKAIAGDGVATGVDQDCNLLVDTGFYSVNADALNLPTEVMTFAAATLVVVKKSVTEITQMLININTDQNIWTRAMLAGVWQPWVYLQPEAGTEQLLEVGDDAIQRTWSAAQLNQWMTDRLQDLSGDDAGGSPKGYAGSKRKIKIAVEGPNINDQTEGPFSPVDGEKWVVYLSAVAKRVIIGRNFEDQFVGGDATMQLEIGGSWVTVKDMPRGGVEWNSLGTGSSVRFIFDDTNNKILICNSDWVTIDTVNGQWSGKFRFKTNGNTQYMTISGHRFKPL